MGRICSVCGCLYGMPANGGLGVARPTGNELCGGSGTFCNNPEALMTSLERGRPYVSSEVRKKVQENIDSHKKRKAEWEAKNGKSKSGGSSTSTTTTVTTVTTITTHGTGASRKKPSTSTTAPTSKPHSSSHLGTTSAPRSGRIAVPPRFG